MLSGAPPPPGQAQPGYPPPAGQPPPGYAPPPGYYQAPQPERPLYLPYREGQKVPPGYYVEDRGIMGLQIAGPVTLGIPYVLGLLIVSAMDYPNRSAWLIVPAAGPFITLGIREDSCKIDRDASCQEEDATARTFLIMDGAMQAAGAAMFITGVAVRRQRLVRETVVDLHLTPMRIGSGFGLGAFGTF